MTSRAVFGIVRRRRDAEDLIGDLVAEGFARAQVSVVVDAAEHARLSRPSTDGAPSAEGPATGALGLIAGMGLGALAAPGVGPLAATGPIALMLGRTAIGATVSSIAAELVALGVPEAMALTYDEKVEYGYTLVALHEDDPARLDLAKLIFVAGGADLVSSSLGPTAIRANQPRGKAPQW